MNIVLGGITIGCLTLGGYLGVSYLKQKEQPGVSSAKGSVMKTNKLIDYDEYHLNPAETLFSVLLAAAFLFILCFIFYRSVFLALLVTPLAFLYPKRRKAQLKERRKQEFKMQFKDALYSLSSSLMAGKSVEMAFHDVHQDLQILYPDPETPIIKEIGLIVRRLEMNETLEEGLIDLARRTHLEDIDSFVDVFTISKRSGGNLVEIIKNTSTIIADKLQIEQEIATMLAQRKLEQKILSIMPIAMILMLSWTTGDYMAPMFTTFSGRLAMTVAVSLLGIANIISGKIMRIEV